MIARRSLNTQAGTRRKCHSNSLCRSIVGELRQNHAGQWHMYELDADLLRDIEDAIVSIELAIADPLHTCVRELLEAIPAWTRGDVVGRAIDVHAVARG